MPKSRVTSKGQITLPKAVRETLHLEVGDEVFFEVLPDGTALLRPKGRPVEDLFGMVAWGGASVPISAMDPGSEDLP